MPNDMMPLIFILGDMVRPEPGHRLILSFDLTMDEAEIREPCPSAQFLMTARLLSRRWIVNSDGIVSAMPCRGSIIHGVVWQIAEADRSSLEAKINVPDRVDRFGAFARDQRERLVAVEYYASRNHKFGEANPLDVVRLMALANRRRFPESYQHEIASFAPGPVEPDNRPRLVR